MTMDYFFGVRHPTKVLLETRLQTHQKTLRIAYAEDMKGIAEVT